MLHCVWLLPAVRSITNRSTGSPEVYPWPSKPRRCILSGIAGSPVLCCCCRRRRRRRLGRAWRPTSDGCHFIITPTVPYVAPLIPKAALRGCNRRPKRDVPFRGMSRPHFGPVTSNATGDQKGRAFPGHVSPPFWPCYRGGAAAWHAQHGLGLPSLSLGIMITWCWQPGAFLLLISLEGRPHADIQAVASRF